MTTERRRQLAQEDAANALVEAVRLARASGLKVTVSDASAIAIAACGPEPVEVDSTRWHKRCDELYDFLRRDDGLDALLARDKTGG